MSAFQREILVRFGHCDAAGWSSTPLLRNDQRFRRGLVRGWVGRERSRIVPSQADTDAVVHFTVDFIKPTRYGERLTFNLWS